MREVTEFLLWQLADSAFPTGGFAHSAGLEAAWQQGEIPDAEGLRRFVVFSVGQAVRAVVPFVNATYGDPASFERCDAMADAFLTSTVANRASRAQGRAWLATCGRVWPSALLAALECRASMLCGHLAPVLGVTLAGLDVPLDAAQRLVVFLAARGVLSAAVRLGVTGSYEAQRLQAACAPDLEAALGRCRGLELDDLAQTAPIVEILQAGHDRLYSKLFSS